MGRKGLVSIFSRLTVDSAPSSSPAAGPVTPPWPWPPCGTNPRTASFRAGFGGGEPCCATTTAAGASRGGTAATANNKLMVRGAAPGEMYKTVNSVYLDDPAADIDFFSLAGDDDEEEGELLDDVDSFSTTTASEEWSEAVIRSLGRTSTDRFFFDPGPLPASNSILATSPARKALSVPAAETKTKTVTPPDPEPEDDGDDAKTRQPCAPSKSLAEGSVAVALDSGDPYEDFRASMEEMVSAHGLRDWAALEELLAWYLRINGKQQHHLIVDAFVDLLLGLASSSPSDNAAETSTSSSSSSSASAGSRCTTSTSTSTAATTTSAAGDAAIVVATTVTTPAAAAAQCGGVNEAAACCSSSSSSCAAGPDIQDDVEEEEEKASSAAAAGADRARASGGAAVNAPLRVPQSIA